MSSTQILSYNSEVFFWNCSLLPFYQTKTVIYSDYAEGVLTWKSGLGLGYGSQAEREFSWYLKGPLNTCDMALRLKVHTADAAMLFLFKTRGKVISKGNNIQNQNK